MADLPKWPVMSLFACTAIEGRTALLERDRTAICGAKYR